MAALDGDLGGVDAQPLKLPGDGLAEPGLQRVVVVCRPWAGDDEDAQDRAVLDDLELADLGVAGEQGEVQGVDGDPAAVAGGKREDVVAAAMDGPGADQGASARAGVGVEGDQVGHLQPEQRLDQVVQVGDEQPGAGLTGRDRPAVTVDVLDQGGVLEQVDALVVLAFGTEQPLRAAVDVKGADPNASVSRWVISGLRSSATVTRIWGDSRRRPACCSSASHMATDG